MYEVIYKYTSILGKHWFLLLMFPLTVGLLYLTMTLFDFYGTFWNLAQFILLTFSAWSITTFFFVTSVQFTGKYTMLNILFSDETDEVSRIVNRLRVYLRKKAIIIWTIVYMFFLLSIPYAIYDYVWNVNT